MQQRTSPFDLRGGKRMDWDAFLSGTVPLVGLDFEMLIPFKEIKLFRGPMGILYREADIACFLPEWFAFWKVEEKLPVIIFPNEQIPDLPKASLVHTSPVRLPDQTIVIVGTQQTQLYCFHPKGRNITTHDLFGKYEILA